MRKENGNFNVDRSIMVKLAPLPAHAKALYWYLYSEAEFSEREYNIKGKSFIVHPGEIYISIPEMVDAMAGPGACARDREYFTDKRLKTLIRTLKKASLLISTQKPRGAKYALPDHHKYRAVTCIEKDNYPADDGDIPNYNNSLGGIEKDNYPAEKTAITPPLVKEENMHHGKQPEKDNNNIYTGAGVATADHGNCAPEAKSFVGLITRHEESRNYDQEAEDLMARYEQTTNQGDQRA